MESQLSSDVSTALQEFKNLISTHEQNKKEKKELADFVALLQEEVKLARDAEKSAEVQRIRYQGYVSQQQEVIQKLLSVKEENENLKQTNRQLEKNMAEIQNNNIMEHVKKEEEIHKIKEEYLRELLKIQKAAEDQVNKVKSDLSSTFDELQLTISKNKETIDQLQTTINSLQTELNDQKQKAAINVDIYQKKLADQEKKYQAELETWKLAEMNRANYYQESAPGQYGMRMSTTQSGAGTLYTVQRAQPPTMRLQSNVMHGRYPHYPGDAPQAPHIVSRIRNNIPSRPAFLTASDYLQTVNSGRGEVTNESEDVEVDEVHDEASKREDTDHKPPGRTVQRPKFLTVPKRRKLLNTNETFLL